ncbi:glycoside hydrolase family 2 protein [Saliphagus infecundisoli]|uniref:Glycoside hydrolase family 2 protein n=1 Tax=Saliphagus infecundisoli TaxID=1849069 RepID=A0ABD5QCW4_9EURY|nr:sugar-binding domain-containing protein [Saliphagus infecundisoli]
MSNHRRETPLTGSWEFVTDPDDEGRTAGWSEPGADWPDRATTVEVPHAWQELDAYREYTGRAWYRRTFAADPGAGERVLLRFGAVDYEATVRVNGKEVGSNRGGYLPFAVDATDAATAGENELVVEVVDPDDLSEIPHGKQGEPWYTRVSGIWQPVSLEVVPALRVAGLRATPDLADDSVSVAVDVIGSGTTGTTALSAAIELRREGDVVASADAPIERGQGSTTIALADPDYWSPEEPALYDVGVALEREGEVVDCYEDYFGMRSVDVDDGQVHLNGEPYPIRGALDQGYYPETFYRPFEPDLFAREVEIAKDLGFNLLRKHIKPAHPDFLEAADRQGLLVWEEPANPTVHTERSRREVRDQLFGMMDRDYNHPSVVVWSLYNEEWGIGNPQGLDDETSLWDDEDKQEYLVDLYEETRECDPTRLVCDNSGWAHVATDVNDYHEYFVSPDRAGAWDDRLEALATSPEENYAATETDPAAAPLIVSEFGTWGMCDAPAIEEFYGGRPPWYDHEFLDGLKRPAGYRGRFEASPLPDVFDDWSDLATAWQYREYRSIKDVIERMRVHSGVDGYVITEFSDIEWEFNGLLDYRREPKAFAEEFARINSPRLLRIDPASHAIEAGGELRADLVVVNDSADPIEGDVEWSVFEKSGTIPVEVPAFATERIEGAVSAPVPSSETPLGDEVRVSHPRAPDNDEPITVVPEPAPGNDLTVYADGEALASRVAALGFETADALEAADAAAVVDPDESVRAYAESGGRVVVVPDADGSMADDEFFAYRELPETESWNLVASLLYAVDLPEYVDRVPGWELKGCYPYAVAMEVDGDEVRLGYLEGWLSNRAAAVSTREVGDGTVTACTLRVGSGDQPVGRALLADLLEGLP